MPNQFGGVKAQLMASTSRPTEAQLRLARDARQDLVTAVASINRIISTTLPAVYQALGQPQLMPDVRPMAPVSVNLP